MKHIVAGLFALQFLLIPKPGDIACPDGQVVSITINGSHIDVSCKPKS